MFVELEKAICNDLQGCVTPAAIRLKNRYNKRFEVKGNTLTRDNALKLFVDNMYAINDLSITLNNEQIANMRHFIIQTLESGSRYCAHNYGTDHWPQQTFPPSILRHPTFLDWGKGSSVVSGQTHVLDKVLENNLSITRDCVPLLKNIKIFSHALWSEIRDRKNEISLVKGSRITTVSKDSKIDRVIACEPTINMWFQLAIGKFISTSLKSVGLDISKQQDVNRSYAMLGSKFSAQWKDPFCTIDLSSASDFVTIDLVRRVLPEDLFEVLMATRSPMVNIGKDCFLLNSVSTMGNGFTFPLLTLICCAIVYASNPRYKNGRLDFKQCAIYGDDIIVRRSVYDKTTSLLKCCGLRVNENKSYASGLFRESCGFDCYDGKVITPFYIRSITTPSEIHIAINQVLHWSCRNFHMENTLEYLFSLLSKKFLCKVPYRFNSDCGIKYPTCEKINYLTYWTHKDERRERKNVSSHLLMFAILSFGNSIEQSHNMTISKKAIIRFATRESKRTFYSRRIYFPFSWDIDTASCVDYDVGFVQRYNLPYEKLDFWTVAAYETIRLTDSQKRKWCMYVDLYIH